MKKFTGYRKVIVAAVIVIGAVVLCLKGAITGEQFGEIVKWVLAWFVSANATLAIARPLMDKMANKNGG